MRVITYCHLKTLGWPVCREPFMSEILDVKNPENTTVITFAYSKDNRQRISAQDRLREHITGDVVCYCWDYSPMAALLLWDVTHAMPVGSCLFLYVSDNVADLLNRDYYKNMFEEESSTENGLRIFRKNEVLPIERERGLEGWSFCIPTGGKRAEMLNTCVARILSLKIEFSEIILCGKPPEDFIYWDLVRVIGEDQPENPVHITRKKNLLANAAKYNNLCILHDRVLLPTYFLSAVQRFGDDYPLVGFESYWFADTWRAVPRRYSDFGSAQFIPSALREDLRPGRQALAEFERMRLVAQHPQRVEFGHDYLTGSLYISKRSLWRFFPQNEAFYWSEYEDVEYGLRAAVAGIPSRINPYAFTESQAYRSIMHNYGVLGGFRKDGKLSWERAPMEWWGFPRRPALSLTVQEGRSRLISFAQKYTGDDKIVRLYNGRKLSGLRRYKIISQLLWRAHGDTQAFIHDWYKNILCEPEVPIESEDLKGVLMSSCSSKEKKWFILTHVTLVRQLFNNFFSSPYSSKENVHITARWKCYIGSAISTIWLRFFYSHSSLALSVGELWRAIRNTHVVKL